MQLGTHEFMKRNLAGWFGMFTVPMPLPLRVRATLIGSSLDVYQARLRTDVATLQPDHCWS
jgi:hypothetical protein